MDHTGNFLTDFQEDPRFSQSLAPSSEFDQTQPDLENGVSRPFEGSNSSLSLEKTGFFTDEFSRKETPK